MSTEFSSNAQAILLLTAPLIEPQGKHGGVPAAMIPEPLRTATEPP